MSVRREITCNVCHASQMEDAPNAGWEGWGQLQGIVLDGVPNPHLCPDCLGSVADYVDAKRQARSGWDHTAEE